MLRARGRGVVYLFASRAREACCGPGTWGCLSQELRRHGVGVEMRRYGGTSIRMARASRAEVVVVKSWLAPQLLPAIQLFLARDPASA